MSVSRDVVITGVGVVSPIGIGKDAFWSSLAQRRSGVQRLDQCGDRLLCVRYRYDAEEKRRYKTVELIVEEAAWDFETFTALTDKVDQTMRQFTGLPAEILALMGRYCDSLGAEA